MYLWVRAYLEHNVANMFKNLECLGKIETNYTQQFRENGAVRQVQQ